MTERMPGGAPEKEKVTNTDAVKAELQALVEQRAGADYSQVP